MTRRLTVVVVVALTLAVAGSSGTAQVDDFTPVTDAMLQNPDPGAVRARPRDRPVP